jgi:hypothetical protein
LSDAGERLPSGARVAAAASPCAAPRAANAAAIAALRVVLVCAALP